MEIELDRKEIFLRRLYQESDHSYLLNIHVNIVQRIFYNRLSMNDVFLFNNIGAPVPSNTFGLRVYSETGTGIGHRTSGQV